MTRFTLISEAEDGTTVSMNFQKEFLPEVLEQFELFLRANDYHFDGHLEFVDEKRIELTEVSTDDYIFEDIHFDHLTESDLQFSVNINDEVCSVCHMNKKTMENWNCYDDKCPKVKNAN